MTKVNIVSMGCSKNLVDSEKLAAQLIANGYTVTFDSEESDAEIAFVNTCGFINDAKEESINAILKLAGEKGKSKLKKIVVFGCLSARYYNDLKEELPEVDFMCGNYNIDELLAFLGKKPKNAQCHSRILSSAGHYAYLKISEGCVRNCSFCAIPLFKGKYVSREMDDIVAEAIHLANKGVKELILIAQDLCFYGYDRENRFLLPELIDRLSEIDGIEWIRLHYLYPFLFPERLLEVIRDNPKVCKYIDIPLQHISNKVLEGMHRGGNKQQTIELLEKIRTTIPEAVIRTTMLVGFPNESKVEFEELVDFVKQQKFDRLGVFTYSEEDGTSAASEFSDLISQEEKEARAERIMEIQQKISLQANIAKIGKTFRVIIDSVDDNYFVGRTQFDSVEVDNEVIFPYSSSYKIGDFVNVKIDDASEYELYGSIID